MKIGISGSRDYIETENHEIFALIKRLVDEYGEDICIVHGSATGADTLAENAARTLQIEYNGIPARWNKYRALGNYKAAGPIRNQIVVDRSDMLFAFHTDITTSRGTADAVRKAIKKGIPVTEFDQKTGEVTRHNDTSGSPTAA